MGNQIRQRESSFTIKAANVPAALDAINHQMFPVSLPTALVRPYRSIAKAFEDDRWKITQNEAGDVVDISFIGEKGGAEMIEETVLWMVREHVEPGSFIEMSGENGDLWRWAFDGKTVQIVRPKMGW